MELLSTIAILLSAVGWGVLVSAARPARDRRLVWTLVVGLSAISAWVTLLGALALLRVPLLLASVHLVGLAGLSLAFRTGVPRERSSAPRWFTALAFAVLAASAWRALIEDATADPYHASVAKAFLLRGGTQPFPGVCETTYAMSLEMLDVLSFAHGTGNQPALLSAVFLALAGWETYRLVESLGWPLGAGLAGVIVWTNPFLARAAGTSSIEAGQALWLVASLEAGVALREGARPLHLLELALLAGVLAGTKDTATVLYIVPLLVVLLLLTRHGPRPRARDVAAPLALFAALAGSWLVRKWIATGDPFYPFFPRLVPGGSPFAAALPVFHLYHAAPALGDLPRVLLVSWNAMLYEGVGELAFGAVAVLLLAVPAARRRAAPWLVGGALAFLASGAARAGQSRFVAPLVPFFAVCGGFLWNAISSDERSRRTAQIALPLLVAMLAVRYPVHAWPMYGGRLLEVPPLTPAGRWDRVRRRDPGLEAVAVANRTLGPEERLLVVSPPRHLEYLDVPFSPTSQFVWDLRPIWESAGARFTHELVWDLAPTAGARAIALSGGGTLSFVPDAARRPVRW